MNQRPFLALWTLAVIATVAAFVVDLGLRGKVVDLGYKLGKARVEQARLREVKRVLELEAASYQAPARVEMVARSLLGMAPPSPERILPIRAFYPRDDADSERQSAGREGPDPSASAVPSASARPGAKAP